MGSRIYEGHVGRPSWKGFSEALERCICTLKTLLLVLGPKPQSLNCQVQGNWSFGISGTEFRWRNT